MIHNHVRLTWVHLLDHPHLPTPAHPPPPRVAPDLRLRPSLRRAGSPRRCHPCATAPPRPPEAAAQTPPTPSPGRRRRQKWHQKGPTGWQTWWPCGNTRMRPRTEVPGMPHRRQESSRPGRRKSAPTKQKKCRQKRSAQQSKGIHVSKEPQQDEVLRPWQDSRYYTLAHVRETRTIQTARRATAQRTKSPS